VQDTQLVICFNCGKKIPKSEDVGGPHWFGSYWNDQLIKVVCFECYKKGVRSDFTQDELKLHLNQPNAV